MKTLLEHMMTQIILLFVLFTLSAFVVTDMQVVAARRMHSSIVDQLEASYYSIDQEAINEKLHQTYPSWNITIDELKTYNTRKECRVTLVYDVVVPLFNVRKAGIIEGYAR